MHELSTSACGHSRRWIVALLIAMTSLGCLRRKPPEYSAAQKQAELDEKIAICTDMIESQPDQVDHYFDRGRYYVARAIVNDHRPADYDSAIADFSEVIRIDPEHSRAYGARGRIYDRRDQLEKAIADYTQVIQLRPLNLADTYSLRAAAYARQGKHDLAAADSVEYDWWLFQVRLRDVHDFVDSSEVAAEVVDRLVETAKQDGLLVNDKTNENALQTVLNRIVEKMRENDAAASQVLKDVFKGNTRRLAQSLASDRLSSEAEIVAVARIRANDGVKIFSVQVSAPGEAGEDNAATLVNTTNSSVSLENWRLVDRSGNEHSLDGEIAALGRCVIELPPGKLQLKQMGDRIQLLQPDGSAVHLIAYQEDSQLGGKLIFVMPSERSESSSPDEGIESRIDQAKI